MMRELNELWLLLLEILSSVVHRRERMLHGSNGSAHSPSHEQLLERRYPGAQITALLLEPIDPLFKMVDIFGCLA